MATKLYSFAMVCLICGLSEASGSSLTLPLHKKDAGMQLPKNQFRDYEGKNLYWFANWTVGDASNLELIIDTGSTDLLINEGFYQPSNKSRAYANDTFEAVYEGVNKAGQGTETIHGRIRRDTVSIGGLTVPEQPIGDITSFEITGARMTRKPLRFDGLVGFYNKALSAFVPPAQSWFNNLCIRKTIAECRFGIAFGTNNTGVSVIGKVDQTLFNGDMAIGPLHNEVYPFWTTRADITLQNKVFIKNQTIVMDTGTTNIQATLPAARKIFKTLGYSTKQINDGPDATQPGKNLTFLMGFFPCDKPPTLGFSIPAQSDIEDPSSPVHGAAPKIFNIFPSDWPVAEHGNNNCTAVLAGTNFLHFGSNDAWLVGQPLYQGRYVDHHSGVSLGYADLVDQANGGM